MKQKFYEEIIWKKHEALDAMRTIYQITALDSEFDGIEQVLIARHSLAIYNLGWANHTC